MKQILYRNLVLIILIVKVVGNNYAQTIPTPINNTPTVLNNLDGKAVFSQSFLTLPIDPRSMSMGLTKIATEPSVYNAYYNPSIIPFTYNSLTSFNLNYLPWTSSNNINDIYYLSAAAFYKINARNTLSSTVRFSNFGKINLLTENLTEIGAANPYNLAVDLSYAKKITNTLSLALTGRYILNDIGANAYNNNIDIILSHSFAADLSLSYLKVLYNNDAIYWGMCISNLGATLGSRYTYDFKNYLPTNFGTGISYNKFVNKYNLVSL